MQGDQAITHSSSTRWPLKMSGHVRRAHGALSVLTVSVAGVGGLRGRRRPPACLQQSDPALFDPPDAARWGCREATSSTIGPLEPTSAARGLSCVPGALVGRDVWASVALADRAQVKLAWCTAMPCSTARRALRARQGVGGEIACDRYEKTRPLLPQSPLDNERFFRNGVIAGGWGIHPNSPPRNQGHPGRKDRHGRNLISNRHRYPRLRSSSRISPSR
jgi:hypothetical protein